MGKTGIAILLLAVLCAAQDDKTKEERRYHERHAELEIEQAKVEVEYANTIFRLVTAQHESGTASRPAVTAAEQRVARAQGDLRLAELALMEVKTTGRAPDRKITAPRAERSDFVELALRIERDTLRRLDDLAQRDLKEATKLHENGLLTDFRYDPIRVEAELSRGRVALAEKLLDVRSRLGDKPADQIEADEKKARAQHALDSVRARLEHAARVFQRTSTNLRNGTATQTDMLMAKRRYETLRIERKLAELELARLG